MVLKLRVATPFEGRQISKKGRQTLTLRKIYDLFDQICPKYSIIQVFFYIIRNTRFCEGHEIKKTIFGVAIEKSLRTPGLGYKTILRGRQLFGQGAANQRRLGNTV